MRGRLALVGFCLVLAAAICVMAFQPCGDALGQQAQLLLGGILATLGIWIFRPFKLPYSMGALFLAGFALAIGIAPPVVFSGFTQQAVWTLVAALFFGFALHRSGLGKRVALGVIRLFRPTYLSLVLAFALIGVALSVLTPSITVRVTVMVPIAASCCELCRLEPGSRGCSLIVLTALAAALVPGGAWLNGSLTGPVIQGAFDAVPELAGMVGFESYSSVALLPVGLASLLMLAGGFLVLRPKQRLAKEAVEAIRAMRLGAMSRDEKITAAVLLAAFALFLTGGLHHIPSTTVCLAATLVLFATGVLKPADVGPGISWDLVVFVGMALSLGAMCAATGITEWLAGLVVPMLAPFAGSPYLLVGALAVALFAWRMIDIANFMPTVALVPPMLGAIQAAYGVHPLVFVPLLYMASCAFFMAYQNSWALMGQSLAGRHAWKPQHLASYGALYFIASIIALMLSVPFWQAGGLFS